MSELRVKNIAPGYGTKLYWVWNEMKKRCDRSYHKKYHRYGGRGIGICPEWRSYSEFYKWAIGNGYSEGLSIDRIDNDGDYEPGNCRWATQLQQSRNTCQNVPIVAFGKSLLAGEWHEVTGIHKHTIETRIKNGMGPEDALTLPPMSASEKGRKGRKIQLAYLRKPEEEGGVTHD
jgi:hypothetical protein